MRWVKVWLVVLVTHNLCIASHFIAINNKHQTGMLVKSLALSFLSNYISTLIKKNGKT